MEFVDAAKRKALPAWIREGLEKMEREKQRKLDREKQLQEREEELIRRKQEEDEALASGIPLKSKFVCCLKYKIKSCVSTTYIIKLEKVTHSLTY